MKKKEDYFLNIHSRNIAVKENESGELEEVKSLTGHFYISLQVGEDKKPFGLYPEGNVLISNAEVRTEKEGVLHDQVAEYAKRKEIDHVYTKSIRLTEEQYERAIKYAESHAGKYVIGLADCTDFVQSVYNAAGLPLYFTTAYSKEEFSQIGNLAANKVSTIYGNRDNIGIHLSSVSGVSREKVASELNVPIEKVIPIPPSVDLDLHPTALPKFRIALDKSDILSTDKISGLINTTSSGNIINEVANVIPPNIRIPFLVKPPLKQEFIDILHAINPKDYPAKFKDWPTDSWGKGVVDRGDLETIKSHLPGYKQQLANKKEAIELLHQINPQAYPARFEDWPTHLKAKKLLDSGDAKTIEKNLLVYRQNLKEKRLIDEFIDLSIKINPTSHPKDFKDWTTQPGKELVDKKDFKAIEGLLPEYRKQLANKREAIELLHQINPQAYPARYEDWPKHIKAKKLLDSGDAKAIEKNLPVYKKNLKEKRLIDEFIDLSIKINPTSHPKDFKDWTTQWGKELVDKKDFKTIEGLLPEYRKQLANKKETIELLYQLYPQAYPPRYDDWPTHLKAKKLLESGDAKTIEKNLLVYRQNLKEKRLIDEFIDLSIKINPTSHPKDFKDWTTQPGKELVDKKDFKAIEGLLPEYRKQLANKREAIELLHQINPQAYPARYEDWPKHIKAKKLLDSGDAKAIEKNLPVYRKLLAEKLAIDPYLTDPVGYITSLMKGIMISDSFEQLKKQCKDAVRECLSKAQKQLAKFISDQAKEEKNYTEDIKAQAQAEVEAAEDKYRSKCDGKYSEYDAKVKAETAIKVANAQAAHVGHVGGCGCPSVIKNDEIVAKYQPIYDNFCKQYKEEVEKEIAEIEKKYQAMINGKGESLKEAIYAKQEAINEGIASLADEINKILKDVATSINTGGTVNFGAIGKQLEQSVAQFLEKAHNTVNTFTVMSVHHIEYDNPVLNHPELIKEMANKFGSGIVDKLIDFGMQFINNQEDREVLDDICNRADSVDAMSLLMGLDVPDGITYH